MNEIKGEKKYGIQTTGADELKKVEARGIDIDHSNIYMPASYDLLESIFKNVDLIASKHFIDIGCGKGRALCVAAHLGAKKLTGIEISKEFCEESTMNLEKQKKQFPFIQYKIYNNDAFYYEIPDDADCIFMFNPFDDVILSGVLENIEMSLERNVRKITIIYINPLHKHMFLDYDYKQVFYEKKMTYLEAVILIKSPGKRQG